MANSSFVSKFAATDYVIIANNESEVYKDLIFELKLNLKKLSFQMAFKAFIIVVFWQSYD